MLVTSKNSIGQTDWTLAALRPLSNSLSKSISSQKIIKTFQDLQQVHRRRAGQLAGLVWENAGRPRQDKFGERALRGDPFCNVTALSILHSIDGLILMIRKGHSKTPLDSKDVAALNCLVQMREGPRTLLKTIFKDLNTHNHKVAGQLAGMVWEEAGKPQKEKFGELALRDDPTCRLSTELTWQVAGRLKNIGEASQKSKDLGQPKLLLGPAKPILLGTKELLPVISSCTISPLAEREIQKTLRIADQYFSRGKTFKVEAKKMSIPRSLLLHPKTAILLMTHRGEGDILVGKGSYKTAKFGVDLRTGEQKIVLVARKADCSKSAWRDIQREVSLLHKLKGEAGIVQLDFAVTTNEKCYLVMEYCNGGELAESMHLNFQDNLRVALDSARGLKNLHARGILHRDIKPANILLIRNPGQPLRAKIADLGFSFYVKDKATFEGGSCSPYWLPPEKAAIKVAGLSDAEGTKRMLRASKDKADIWSLGCTFFQIFNPAKQKFSWQYDQVPNESDEVTYARIASLSPKKLKDEIQASGMNSKVADLIVDMVQVNPANRISMRKVYERVRKICMDLCI